MANPIKSKALVISRLGTLASFFLDLLLDGSVVERVTVLKVLGVV